MDCPPEDRVGMSGSTPGEDEVGARRRPSAGAGGDAGRPAGRPAGPTRLEPGRHASIASRVDQLERALIATLRENATNWARAERAERLLAERERDEG